MRDTPGEKRPRGALKRQREGKERMGRKGQHYMTERERYQLEAYLRVGKPKAWIARIMGFCRQTIYNETRRGEAHVIRLEHGYYYDRQEYSADKAQQIHDYNQTAKGRPIKLGNHYDYARRLEDLMLGVQPDGKIDRRKRYSPYAALAIAGKEGYPISICTSTLYSYIDKGVFLHLANKDLWQKWRRRKRKYHPIQRVAHAHLPSIEARPQTINDRAEPGHWEMDLVVGKAQSTINNSQLHLERLRQSRGRCSDSGTADIITRTLHAVLRCQSRKARTTERTGKEHTQQTSQYSSPFLSLEILGSLVELVRGESPPPPPNPNT
jgi:IS30 family transposase